MRRSGTSPTSCPVGNSWNAISPTLSTSFNPFIVGLGAAGWHKPTEPPLPVVVLCLVLVGDIPREELSMIKTALVGLAVLTVSASVATAAQHKSHRHATKPPSATAATPASPTGGPVFGMSGVSSADREMYMKNQRDAGLAGKK